MSANGHNAWGDGVLFRARFAPLRSGDQLTDAQAAHIQRLLAGPSPTEERLGRPGSDGARPLASKLRRASCRSASTSTRAWCSIIMAEVPTPSSMGRRSFLHRSLCVASYTDRR